MSSPNQEQDSKQFEELVKVFNNTIISYTMYPDEHSICKENMRRFHSYLSGVIETRQSLTLGVVEGKLLIEDCLLDETKPFITRFVNYFKKLELDAITIQRGFPEEELNLLLRVLSLAPDRIQKQGGPQIVIENLDLQYISVGKVRYERVSDDDVVVPEGQALTRDDDYDGERFPDEEEKVSFYKGLRMIMTGEVKSLRGMIDERMVLNAMRMDPKKVVALISQVGEEIGDLRLAVERLGDWMVLVTNDFGSRLKVDLSKLMAIFGRRIQEEILSTHEGDDALSFADTLGVVISRYIEKIKLAMLMYKFSGKKKASHTEIAETFSQVASSEEEKQRLLVQLKKQWQEDGLSESEIEKLAKSVERVQIQRVESSSDTATQRLMDFQKEAQKELEKLKQLEQEIKNMAGMNKGEPQTRESEERGQQPEADRAALSALKENQVAISKAEYEQLRKKTEEFEEILRQRVEALTAHLGKKNKETLKEYRRLDRLIHEMAKGLIVVDSDDNIVLLNRAAEEVIGMHRDAAIMRPIAEVLNENHLLAFTNRNLIEGELVTLLERSPHSRKLIRASTAVVEDEDGKPVGILRILDDVQKQSELDQLREKIIATISDGILKPLVASKDALGLVSGGMAGDLNNEQRRLLNDVRDNLVYLNDNLHKIVAFTEAEDSAPQIAVFDIRYVIEGIVAKHKLLTERKKIKVTTEIKVKRTDVMGDKVRTTKALEEIVVNAIKATGQGGTIRIACLPFADATGGKSNQFEVVVEDSGVGVPEGVLPEVFEKFTTFGEEEELRGLGLGLAFVRQVIKAQGGNVWMKSRYGKGTMVHFTIPVAG